MTAGARRRRRRRPSPRGRLRSGSTTTARSTSPSSPPATRRPSSPRAASEEIARLQPTPPALELFDAGMGDATVLVALLRTVHDRFPTVPRAGRREGDQPRGRSPRAREDARPVRRASAHGPRRHEPLLRRRARAPAERPGAAARLNWQEVALEGASAHELGEQIEALGPLLAPRLGDEAEPGDRQPDLRAAVGARALPPRPRVPAPRRDPRLRASHAASYDFVLASQPWRARMAATFKAEKILAPLARSLAPGGRLLAIQSLRARPGRSRSCSGSGPTRTRSRSTATSCSAPAESSSATSAGEFDLTPTRPTTRRSSATRCTRCPRRSATASARRRCSRPGTPSSTSTRSRTSGSDPLLQDGSYLEATQDVLQEHGGLWFNDEAFVVVRRGIVVSDTEGV